MVSRKRAKYSGVFFVILFVGFTLMMADENPPAQETPVVEATPAVTEQPKPPTEIAPVTEQPKPPTEVEPVTEQPQPPTEVTPVTEQPKPPTEVAPTTEQPKPPIEVKEQTPEVDKAPIKQSETAAIKIQPYSLVVTEGGKGAVYTILLTSEPQEEVAIELSHDEQIILDKTTLKFTKENWKIPQMVVVTPHDDFVVEESPHKSIINHSVMSSDMRYNGMKVNDVRIEIHDNDKAGLLLSSNLLETAEGGKIGIYTMQLESQPSSDVTVTLTHDPQVQLDKTTLTFTAKNWKVAQAVIVTPIDDPIVEENPHKTKIVHSISSTDKHYNEMKINDVEVSIQDNDSYGITISPIELLLKEGEKKDYTVQLKSQPKSDVTFTIIHDSQTQIDKETLTFTDKNWNTAQTVSVTAVDDSMVEENPHITKVTHTVTSSDKNYSGLTIDTIKVSIEDNDSPGIEISPTTLELAEGDKPKKYSIKLKSQPTSDVVVQIANDAQVSVDKENLSFTSSNWNLPQTVTVTAVDDSEIEATPHFSVIKHNFTSSDTYYNELKTDNISISIADNDTPGIVINPKLFTLTEGQTVKYTIELKSQPTSDIKINLTHNEQIEANPKTITFTKENWKTPQEVIVTAVDDSEVEEKSIETVITHQLETEEPNYKELKLEDVKVTVNDNDSPGVTISLFSLKVAEGGETSEYTVQLNSKPTSDVNIEIVKDAQLSVDKESLLFTTENWKEPQTVIVTAVDDPAIESNPHLGTITHKVKSEDKNYNEFKLNNTVVSITDNDAAGVKIEPITLKVAEGGATGEYSVQLTAQPASNVEIKMVIDKQVKLDKDKLSFSKSNWNIPQKVQVKAVDDTITEGIHNSTIKHTASGQGYENVSIEDVSVEIEDNENSEYVDNMDGTVKDISTNLVWMKCSQGQKWSGAETNTCTGNAITYQVCEGGTCETEDAAKACSSLNEAGGFAGKTLEITIQRRVEYFGIVQQWS